MPELLLELLSEEIPARMQARAAEDLKSLVTTGLEKMGLDFDQTRAFATPRRLALVVDGLREKQPDRAEERRGPRVGATETAINGFLKSAGLDTVDQCEVREVGGNEFYFVVKSIKGRSTSDVLPDVLSAAVLELSWPKSMRWSTSPIRWVRPMHKVMCLFGSQVVELNLPVAIVELEPSTVGHRFLAPEPFAVKNFADYERKLRKAKVILDPEERKKVIRRKADALAVAEGLTVKDDPALLDEVAGLVEWPVPLMGRIDEAFMSVPAEVLTASMRTHQRYFALLDREGRLAPRFIVVANTEARTKAKRATIIAGNERVLRARLSDAKFFWNQDRKRELESRIPDLNSIIFHERLGTLGDKVDRIEALAVELAERIPGADRNRVRSAARLAKADLTTEMVGEFPELQGIMGRHYALHDGEHPDVARAIAEHYAPLGPNDTCPGAPVSVAVALADKIDTLVGFFAVSERPTGSKDPYALRRAALGVIRLIIENRLRLPLQRLFALAHQAQPVTDASNADEVGADLMAFFADRLKVHLREKGVRHDLISAIFERGGEDDLVRLLARVDALREFLDSEDGGNLLVAYRRAANIVRIEEKKDKARYDGPVDENRFEEEEERALHESLTASATVSLDFLNDERFTDAMSALAKLRRPVDTFFDEVTVNVPDRGLRENRLRLLAQIQASLDRVADFSRIEG